MVRTACLLSVLLLASCPAWPGEDTHILPGSKTPLDEVFKNQVDYVVACEAVDKPSSRIIGNMTDHAIQAFKVVAPLAGKCPEGKINLRYEIIAPNDRDVAKGERVIVIMQSMQGRGQGPVTFLADTEANRQSVVAFAKAMRMTIAADTQPATMPATAPVEALSARISIPDKSKAVDGKFGAWLDLVNTGTTPLRLCTQCQAWPSSSSGQFEVALKPDQWKSDAPANDELAQRVVTLTPGKSVSIGFEILVGDAQTVEVKASYSIGPKFAAELKTWTGTAAAPTVTIKKSGDMYVVVKTAATPASQPAAIPSATAPAK